MHPIEIRSTRFIARLLVSCVALLAGAAASASAQPPTEKLVVFGTSLSDPGNAFALVGGTNTPPDYLVDPFFLTPNAPYTRGGHHFTNGPTWIEQLARTLRANVNAEPAFKGANPRAMNFAIATSRAREDGINPSLALQVNTFLQATGGVASPNALHVIEMGSNDVRDALAAGPGAQAILLSTLDAIRTNVMTLYAAGARRFLIWNVPNPALSPAIRILNSPQASAGATLLATTFNQGLDGQIAVLRATLPGIDIVKLDVFQLLNIVVANRVAFGFTNVTTPCITPSEAPFFCQQPDEYLFWDGIHPTSEMHGIVAQFAELALGD
jgi:phospholipase/lecithinase/hemolysin